LKVEAECANCLVHRGYREILEATIDPSLQFEAISAVLRLLSREFKATTVPSYIGTKRDRLIKKITGNPDPYARKKKLSNQKAMEVLPLVKTLVSNETSPEARFRKACLGSIVGNIIEFDIPGHTFKFGNVGKLLQRAELDLAIDEISQIFNLAKKAKKVLYLTDNAGEIAFDTLLVRELKKLGPRVAVAVKAKPILNDATLEDAKHVGMHEVADDLITLGTDSVGLILEECSKEFLGLYNSVNLVVAKGMGYAESITEIDPPSPQALLLRAKCQPVANFFKVEKGNNIATLIFNL
jgi:uncharacterized protein with ATP-grasp and redox domains